MHYVLLLYVAFRAGLTNCFFSILVKSPTYWSTTYSNRRMHNSDYEVVILQGNSEKNIDIYIYQPKSSLGMTRCECLLFDHHLLSHGVGCTSSMEHINKNPQTYICIFLNEIWNDFLNVYIRQKPNLSLAMWKTSWNIFLANVKAADLILDGHPHFVTRFCDEKVIRYSMQLRNDRVKPLYLAHKKWVMNILHVVMCSKHSHRIV